MSEMQRRIAYIQGLAEGYGLDEQNPQGQIIMQLVDVLGVMAQRLDELSQDHEELEEYIGEIDDDLMDLEEAFAEENLYMSGMDSDLEEDLDEDFLDELLDDEQEELGLQCTNCNMFFQIDPEIGDAGDEDDDALDLTCPDCGEILSVYHPEGEKLILEPRTT